MKPRTPHPQDAASPTDTWMIAAVILLVATAFFAVTIIAGILGAPDLKALWMAGQFWKMGQPEHIYPPDGPLFTMQVPEAWLTWLTQTEGEPGEIYPYLYPPIWVVLTAAISGPEFATFASWSLWINAFLVAGTVVLAIRATHAALNPMIHTVMVLICFTTTFIAIMALSAGQPQILVSFLIVLAIERSRAGAQFAAGAALGLAAALKLYPAVFVVVWIARGQWRAVGAFLLTGGGLALMSIGLAGWDLHREFLDAIAQINRTILITRPSLNLDAVLAQFVVGISDTGAGLTFIRTEAQQGGGWYTAPRSPMWSLLKNMAMAVSLIGLAIGARRASDTVLYAAIWPLMLIVSVLFAPIGWIYYMIPVAVFAPVTLAFLRPTIGLLIWAAGVLAFAAIRFDVLSQWLSIPKPATVTNLAGALLWAAGFALVWIRLRR